MYEANLSGIIAANVTLIQPDYIKILTILAPVISGLIAGSAALIGVWIAQNHNKETEKLRHKQKLIGQQEELYAKLFGQKALFIELFSSHINYLTQLQVLERQIQNNRVNQAPIGSDLETLRFLNGISSELKIKLAENLKELWSLFGSIKVLFESTPQIDSLISGINTARQRYIEVAGTTPPDGLSNRALMEWGRNKQSTAFESYVSETLEPAFDHLTEHINEKIKEHQRSILESP